MCGIAGFIDLEGHSKDAASRRIKAMTDAIPYRGPDADGFYVDEMVALGHRRLSIIDLASGHQPMAAAAGQIQIAFNGEIYNFQSLRHELEGLGHEFVTRSDTEVILQAYLAWGEGCLGRLNGMFAFALWDRRSRQLMLARDRVGEKPLYWVRQGSRVAFGSELKALRAGGGCPDAIDPEALDSYFTLGYIPSPRTIYAGVNKLRAAHCLVIGSNGVRERRYWHLTFADPRPMSLDDATDELGSLIDDAVKCRMVSEVPLGAFLSGGLDSSLVVESMSRQSDRPVITNSIGFDEREFNELDVARVTAGQLATDHHESVIRPDAASILPQIAFHFDEPLADSSAIPTWYVCQMARHQVTVALSGDGGDEAFAGYTFRYLPHAHESLLRARIPAAVRSAVLGPVASVWPASAKLPKPLRLKTILGNLATSDAEAFYRDLAWLRDETRSEVYAADFMKSLRGFSAREFVYPLYVGSDAPDAVGRAQQTDIQLYMTDDVLAKVDRVSMAHSLEVRCPLLDPSILELGARLPASVRMGGGKGKLPLRSLAARRLPAEVINMPKKGFSIPAARWLREDLKATAESCLFDSGSLVREWLDERALKRIWSEHLNGSRNHSAFIWAAMMFSLWNSQRDKPAVEFARAA
jgi:asparagine synthase (glutamine-hydrolysing)